MGGRGTSSYKISSREYVKGRDNVGILDRIMSAETDYGARAEAARKEAFEASTQKERDTLWKQFLNLERLDFEQSFNRMPKIMEAQGFDGLPTVVTPDELTAYAKENNLEVLWRGVSSSNAANIPGYLDNFLNGPMEISGENSSTYGRGIYAANLENVARSYANSKKKGGAALQKFVLSKDANVVTMTGKKFSELTNSDTYTKSNRGASISDRMAAQGVDAIRITGAGKQKKDDYIIIMNRTAIVTDGRDYI